MYEKVDGGALIVSIFRAHTGFGTNCVRNKQSALQFCSDSAMAL